MSRNATVVSCVVVALVALAPPARAYDAATTQAGITEKATLASALHRVLSRRLGRPLGLLEPLQVHSRTLDAEARRGLWARLGALDPAGGYRPGVDGVATALAWVVAGSVLAETPPERGRHHFLDPRTRAGLDDAAGLAGFAHVVRLAVDDGATVRDLATGTAFDLTGRASVEWVVSPHNDQGLPVLLDQWERAAAAAEPAARESALVRALLALGGIVAVLEDAGDPAHVRNDFRGTYLQRQGHSSWDRGSAYERFVAGRYGRTGVPAPAATVRRPTLESYFTAADRQGLADRTNRRFFSEGTLPADAIVDPAASPGEVLRQVRESLTLPSPTVKGLVLADLGRRRYLTIEGRKALAYVQVPGRVRFFLDGAVYADTAKALLPEVGAYAAGLLDHLLRASLQIQISGRAATITLDGAVAPTKDGALRVYAEDGEGTRKELAGVAPAGPLAPGQHATLLLPAGVKRIAAVFRGRDAAGPFVATGEMNVE